MSAEAFVTAARSLKGAKWRHRGRKEWAVDCVGLIIVAGAASGLDTGPDERRYGIEPWDDRLRKGLRERFGAPVDDPPQHGDIALIRWRQEEPSHAAIVAEQPSGGLSLIHVSNVHGVVEVSLRPPYTDCVVEIYRPWHATYSR